LVLLAAQLGALAEAGFHVVAPDMRGYGKTDRPEEIEKYTLLHLVGDMVGLLDAFGAESAVIAGHDWGAPVAWHSALLRPDRFRGVIGLSVPFRPRTPVRPTSAMPQSDDALFYQLYFQTPGVARLSLSATFASPSVSVLYSLSGDAPRSARSAERAPTPSVWCPGKVASSPAWRRRLPCRAGSLRPTWHSTRGNLRARGSVAV